MRDVMPHSGGRRASIDATAPVGTAAVATAVAAIGATAGMLAGLASTGLASTGLASTGLTSTAMTSTATTSSPGAAAGAALVAVAVVTACAATGACAGAAAVVDVVSQRIPNRLVLAILGAGTAVCVGRTWDVGARSVPSGHLAARVAARLPDLAEGLALAAAGCALAGAPMLAVRLARGIGMGDIKLAGALGASLMANGWWFPLAAIAVAAAGAAVAGSVTGRAAMPLAPFLAAGWCLAMACAPIASAPIAWRPA